MPAASIAFIYLDIQKDGAAPPKASGSSIFLEVQYSLATLLAEAGAEASIIIYTDKPEKYAPFPVMVENLSGRVPAILGEYSYIYRAKPWVLLDALRKRGGTCVFLDSDTFILPGFLNAIREKSASFAIMHDVYWGFEPAYTHAVTKPFPNKSRHTQCPSRSFGGNSGVIGAGAGWGEGVLEDAIHIIDEVLPTKNWHCTLEQHAIAEAIWLHGIEVEDVRPWVFHYYRNSQKRYMHFQIKRMLARNGGVTNPTRPCIEINDHRVKLYQYFHDVKTFVNNIKTSRASYTESG